MLPYLIILVFLVFCSFIHSAPNQQRSLITHWIPLLLVTVFGGIRFQTGYDWLPYTLYFEQLPTNFSEGISGEEIKGLPSMEPSYFLINYFIKNIGLSFDFVFLTGAFFNWYALRKLLATIPNNNAFSLLIQVSFCLVYFYFSTVRQAAAVGFVLLACRELILFRRGYVIFIYWAIATSFQVSAIMYAPILLLAYTKFTVNFVAVGIALIFIGIPLVYFDVFDFAVSYLVQNTGFAFFQKFALYQGIQKDAAWPTFGLLVLSIFSTFYISIQTPNDERQAMLARLASIGGIALAVSIVISPNVSTTWTRMLMVSSTIQGFWYSAHCSYLPKSKILIIKLICISISIPIYVFSVYRSIDFLVPYQTIIDRDYFGVDPTNEINTLENQKNGI